MASHANQLDNKVLISVHLHIHVYSDKSYRLLDQRRRPVSEYGFQQPERSEGKKIKMPSFDFFYSTGEPFM